MDLLFCLCLTRSWFSVMILNGFFCYFFWVFVFLRTSLCLGFCFVCRPSI